MPNIPQYENQIDRIVPSDKGIEAATMAGRRIGSFYHQMGQDAAQVISTAGGVYERHEEMKEISAMGAASAKMGSDLQSQWNSWVSNADPNDHTLAQRFRDTVLEPALSKFQETPGTQAGKMQSIEQANHWRQHFYETTAVDQANLAGTAMVQNLEVTKNNLGQMVKDDWTSADTALGLLDKTVTAQIAAGNLRPEQATHVRETVLARSKSEIAQQAVMGQAQSDPEGALATLRSGKYGDYIDGGQRDMLERYIDAQGKINAGKVKAQETARIKAEDDVVERSALDVRLSVGTDAQGNPVVPADYFDNVRALGHLPGAERKAGMIGTLIEVGQRGVREAQTGAQKGVTDPHTYDALRTQLINGDLDTLGVDRARASGFLNAEDYHELHGMAEDLSRPDKSSDAKSYQQALKQAFATAKSIIAPSAGPGGTILKPAEAQNYYLFQKRLQADHEYWVGGGKMDEGTWEKERLGGPHPGGQLQSFLTHPDFLPHYAPGSYNDQIKAQIQVIGGKAPTALAPANRTGITSQRMNELDKIAGGH